MTSHKSVSVDDEGGPSLPGNTDNVAADLAAEPQERPAVAGMEVPAARS